MAALRAGGPAAPRAGPAVVLRGGVSPGWPGVCPLPLLKLPALLLSVALELLPLGHGPRPHTGVCRSPLCPSLPSLGP